jgi:hypothetical protein
MRMRFPWFVNTDCQAPIVRTGHVMFTQPLRLWIRLAAIHEPTPLRLLRIRLR